MVRRVYTGAKRHSVPSYWEFLRGFQVLGFWSGKKEKGA
jgi:hypothetical protein